MAGTNDAIASPLDVSQLNQLWATMCTEPKLVVTLAPPTRSKLLNARIAEINAIARQHCQSRPIVDLDVLADEDGLLDKRYTVDGVHFSEDAYEIWRTKLTSVGI